MERIEDGVILCPHCGYDNNSQKENPLHIDPGEILRDRFIIGKAIGYGGFGVTYIGWDALLEHKVAIKEYMPSEFSTRALGTKEVTVFGGKKADQFSCGLKRFHDEAKMLAKYNAEEGIVSVYDSFEENGTAYIIMELLDGISFSEHLRSEPKMPYEKAVPLILPIIRSLESIHAQGVLHRDIAPDNLILTKDGKVKLIDFGAARFVTSSQHSMSVLIKPGYTPEEQYSSHSEQGPYTDVYALSAVLYRMITGETPPDSLERGAYYEKHKKDMLVPISAFVKDVPENIQNAIYNAMCVRAADRTRTMEEFERELTSQTPVVLRNKWLKKTGLPLWSKLLIAAAAVTAVVVCAVVIPGMTQRQDIGKPEDGFAIEEGMARVPSVLDQTLDKAVERLTEQSLLYSIAGKEYSTEIAADLVLSQSIDGGAVIAKNSMIDLVISGGAEMAEMVPLEGMASQEAAALLAEAGFTHRFEEAFSDTIAEGYVIRQSVQAGTELAVGSEVVLTVSKGRDPEQEFEETLIEAPDFVGKDYETVLQLAQEQQLVIVVKEKLYNDEYPENTVMGQNIEAGTEIMTGSTIELTVSLGVQVIRVPDLEYRTLDYARSQLDRLGLGNSVRYENSDVVQAGLVISYTPGRDAQAAPGDTVYLVVSLGPVETATNPPATTQAPTEQTKPVVTEAPTTETTKPETQEIQPTGITFTGADPELTIVDGAPWMYVGESNQLFVSVTPENATDKTMTFSSDNPSVISVDDQGKITAHKAGTATITAKTNNNGKSTSIEVTAEDIVLTLYTKSVTMPRGATFEFEFDTNAPDKRIYVSCDGVNNVSHITTVRNFGVTPYKYSVCFERTNDNVTDYETINCQFKLNFELNNSVVTRSITLTLTGPLTAELLTKEMTLEVGDIKKIDYEPSGSDMILSMDNNGNYTTHKNEGSISFSSDDTGIATVDDTGNVAAIAPGKTTIHLKVNDEIVAQCTVIVTE